MQATYTELSRGVFNPVNAPTPKQLINAAVRDRGICLDEAAYRCQLPLAEMYWLSKGRMEMSFNTGSKLGKGLGVEPTVLMLAQLRQIKETEKG